MDSVKLWTSGEIQADVGDAFRLARMEVEDTVNAALNGDYGAGFTGWTLIAIIREVDDPTYAEIKRYRKKDGFEFRLKLDHATFKAATEHEQRKLMADLVRRSIAEMRSLAAKNVECDRLQAAVGAALEAKGWG